MRFRAKLKSNTGDHELDLDLSHVHMTSEQRAISEKLFESIKDEPIKVDTHDPCEAGQCLASNYLSEDEFSKIRGLKAQLGTTALRPGVFIDYCIHVYVLPD